MIPFNVIQPNSHLIRPVPYPYQGMLTISNDVEYFTFRHFEEFMKFVNTQKDTALGKGLGLEISSSMFFYSTFNYDFTYFTDTSKKPALSKWASRINEYILSGWIDTSHSFGNFSRKPIFTRQHALNVYEALDKIGGHLPVYTNHGNQNNIQNVGDGRKNQGDASDSQAYHADLFVDNGVSFLNSFNMSFNRLLDHRNNKEKVHSTIVDTARSLLFFMSDKKSMKIGSRTVFGPSYFKLFKQKKSLIDVELKNGQEMTGFTRMGTKGIPILSNLEDQLNLIDWNDFYSKNGCVVIYQHLGVIAKHLGYCDPTTIEVLQQIPESLNGLRFLSREFHQGRLLVWTTFRYLRYMHMIRNTDVIYDEKIKEFKLCTRTPILDSADDYFQGLTLYVQGDSNEEKITYNNHQLTKVICPKDENGSDLLQVKIQQLPSIW